MAFTHTASLSYIGGAQTIAGGATVVGDSEPSLTISIPDSSTNLELPWSLEIGNGIVGLVMLSDQSITLYTNAPSGGVPDDTIDLIANVPWVWFTGYYDDVPITADILTSLFVTNASGSAATLQIQVLTDVLA